MAILSLGQAARLTGLGKTTITRAIKSGRLSASRKEDGSYEIDAAELARVYPFPAPGETVAVPVVHHATADVTADVDLRHRLATAEERLTELKALVDDLRRDRDAWRDQAQGRLLPSPASKITLWRWLRTTG
jgi:excisionase family DNA binding protein